MARFAQLTPASSRSLGFVRSSRVFGSSALPAPRAAAPTRENFRKALLIAAVFGGLAAGSLRVEAQSLPEPCPEGLFRDLSSDPPECRYLEFPFWGADPSIPDTHVSLDPALCTRPDIQAALNTLASQSGGTLHLPACSVEIDQSILVPSHTALKGAGPGLTVFFPAYGYGDPLIRVKRATDVRVSGLSADGRDRVTHTIEIRYSRNVLLEEIDVQRVTQNGLVFFQSRNVTVRYSTIHDIGGPGAYNGIGAKDCYPDRGDTHAALCEDKLESLAQSDFNASPECGASYCPCNMAPLGEGPGYCFGYGSLYTNQYNVYSNSFARIVNDYCLALHARNGEVAGNLCEQGRHGMKSPDAWDVFVHDNLFRDNTGWGYFVYGPIRDIHPRRVHLYRNQFIRQGDVPIRAEGPEGLYIVHNTYEDNCRISTTGYCTLGSNVIVNNYEVFFDVSNRAPQTYICGGSSAEDVLNTSNKISPVKPYYADSGTCYQILPLEIVDLSVRDTPSGLEITWRTDGEQGIAAFEIEESAVEMAGEATWSAWVGIGRVDAQGAPTAGRTYRWVKEAPETLFLQRFRVKQVNGDGAVYFTPSVEWRPSTPMGLQLSAFYPSPASDLAVGTLVAGEDRQVRVELVGMRGEYLSTLFDGRLPAHVPMRLSIDAGASPSGTVFVVATDGLTRVVRPLVVTH